MDLFRLSVLTTEMAAPTAVSSATAAAPRLNWGTDWMTTSTNQVPEVRWTSIPKSADSVAELENGTVTEMVGKSMQNFGVQMSPNGVGRHMCGMQKSRKLRSTDSVRETL